VDEAHRGELLRVAASERADGGWEGSAWAGGETLPAAALHRHALVVPRLVAPHRNRSSSGPVSAVQALAMLVQVRLSDLHEQQEQHGGMPSLADASSSDDWDWRLVGALGRRLTEGEAGSLAETVLDAPDPARGAAAAVAAGAALVEEGRTDEGIALLDGVLALDDADPVDQAWLAVQKARACAEVGRLDEARELAAGVQSMRATHARAVAGAGALLLFNTSGWQAQDVASSVAGADSTAAWWRTQTAFVGLAALTERTFCEWSRDRALRFTAGHEANDAVLSAALVASHMGDHGSWRGLAALLGQDGLLRLDKDADPLVAADALEELRRAGDEKSVALAVGRLADDGPAVAVRAATARVDLSLSTRTTVRPDLALLRHGDLLDRDVADRAVGWVLATLADPAEFVRRTTATFRVDLLLVETLGPMVAAASPARQRDVAGLLVALPPVADEFLRRAWAAVVGALPHTVWTPRRSPPSRSGPRRTTRTCGWPCSRSRHAGPTTRAGRCWTRRPPVQWTR